MSNPYNYPFIQKDNTMYLSTICTFFFIQPSRIFLLSLPSLDRVHSNKKIFLGLHLKSLFHSNLMQQTTNYLLISNQFLIDTGISKNHQTPYSLMIQKELDLNALISEQEEQLILYVQNICFPLHLKQSWIQVANSFVILWKLMT